jgi:hypothetical protein
LDAVREAAWTTVTDQAGRKRRKLTPEGLYGRWKMTGLIRRTRIAGASQGAIDRGTRALELEGIRRDKGIRTTIPGKDGVRAADLLNRDFTAPRPDHTWVDGLHVLPHMGRVGLCRVHPERVLATHRRLACTDHETRRARDDPAAHGTVGTRQARGIPFSRNSCEHTRTRDRNTPR